MPTLSEVADQVPLCTLSVATLCVCLQVCTGVISHVFTGPGHAAGYARRSPQTLRVFCYPTHSLDYEYD